METAKQKARLAIYCPNCSGEKPFFFLTTEANFNNHCPKCGEFLSERMCIRCGHKWIPKNFTTLARVCPNPRCKSPLWCRERIYKKK
jgi:hypothetical protein